MHFLYGFTKDNEIILDHATFHSKSALTTIEENSLFAAISYLLHCTISIENGLKVPILLFIGNILDAGYVWKTGGAKSQKT